MMKAMTVYQAGYELQMNPDGFVSFVDVRTGNASSFLIRAEDLKYIRKLIDEMEAIVAKSEAFDKATELD